MNEHHFTYKIRQHLNRGLHELRPEITTRLAAARQGALAHQRQVVRQSVMATVGSYAHHHLDHLHLKQLFTALALLVCVVFSAFWVADQRVTELGAIDSALLADELPIKAFTDKGFDAWLKRASSQ
ncbi:DUF3619 family protein [Propionivibrio sp.]|uniref:DUF3619 family protein n=1 Tax=Propionivibrio sp. TaxID=2212460 RepID=UPI00262599B0|nr:DUF3619 family protein [Propionivibrio sp.]